MSHSCKFVISQDNITVGESKIHCAFWDFNGRNGLGGWSFEGVSTESFNSTHAHCASKHLTSFLVLVSPVPIEQVKNIEVMNYIYVNEPMCVKYYY